MIFQLRSFGCVILLLLIFGIGTSTARVLLLQSGMVPLNRGDVAMVFYATVQNPEKEIQTVRLSMTKCCLVMVNNSVDCNIMQLQNGLPFRIQPNKTYNITAYFVNKNLFGRNGECELGIMSSSSKQPLAEFKTQFNTSSSDPNLFQYLYMSLGGNSEKERFKRCATADQDPSADCQSGECVLDYSGKRSFYNRKSKSCESTPECLDATKMMLSSVTNLCRHQYPSSRVISSLTPEMKEGINDTDVMMQKMNPVEPVKVVCVNGKMDAKGHCHCDENWLSLKFEPQKLDPEKTPYYMCNVRSPNGEITDRTLSTNYAFTVLIILLVILLPCCTGVVILSMYMCQRKRKNRKKSIEELSKDLSRGKTSPDKSKDVISEITSRREIRKSSTSRRSSNGQDQTTTSQCSVNDTESKQNHTTNSQSSNTHQSSSHTAAIQSKTIPSDAHHHPTTASHIITREPSKKARKDADFQGFEEISLIDWDNEENRSNNAFRSRSDPLMNMKTSYFTPELVAVPSSPEMYTKAYFSTSRTLAPILEIEQNITSAAPNFSEEYSHPADVSADNSEIDVRSSVKRKQELWAKFLKNYSESHAIRQHSEFGIKDIDSEETHAYPARSLPEMNSHRSNTSQRDANDHLSRTVTYTVFKSEQESVTPISSTESINDIQSISSPKINIEEIENILMAAMKSTAPENLMEADDPKINLEYYNRNSEELQQRFNKERDPNILESESLDSMVLLNTLPLENKSTSNTSLEYTSSDSSDILVGSPIGRNKFWVQQFNALTKDRNEITDFSQEKNPHDYKSALKQLLRTSASNPNNSSKKDNTNTVVQDNPAEEEEEDSSNIITLATIMVKKPKLAGEDKNSPTR